MRIFSWAGGVALAAAVGVGYLANELAHQRDAVTCCLRTLDAPEIVEASEAPPSDGPRLEPAEVIDLSCVPSAVTVNQFVQTTEPPLAAPAALPDFLRTVNFELPAGAPDGPELPPSLPYLKDDADAPPARLPVLADAPPAGEPSGPAYEAVKKFFQDAAQLPVTDKVPLGQPPVCERPPDAEVGAPAGSHCPGCPQDSKADTPGNELLELVPLLPKWFVGPPRPEQVPVGPSGGEASEAPQARAPQRLAPVGADEESAPRPHIDTMEIRPGDVPRPKVNEPY
jgi:hypothetical protein